MTGANERRVPSVELEQSDRSQPAGRVFALVLDALLEQFRELEPAVLTGDDPDALHDYRVVVRRARSVLRAGAQVYPPAELDSLRDLTARLAGVSSPVRDLDVLLGALDDYCGTLSDELRDGVEPLRAELQQRRDDAHHELVELVTGEDHPALLRRWQVMASVHRIGGSDPGPDALRPTAQVADELIGHAFHRARRRAKSLLESDDRRDWHSARKRLKRLRYTTATFAALYPPGAFAPMLEELSEVQDRFGALQDHLVHADLVESVGVHLGGRAALAAGAISDELHRRSQDDLRRCRKAIRRLRRKAVRRTVREALG